MDFLNVIFNKRNFLSTLLLLSFLGFNHLLLGQSALSIGDLKGRTRWGTLLKQDADFFKSADALHVADNVLLYQRESGGWPKNMNMTKEFTTKEKKQIKADKKLKDSTIDNDATYPQMRFLAKVYLATQKQEYKDAFNKGLSYLFEAQYDNGGWPQYYPLRKGYYSHITYNDNAMMGVMNLLRDIALNHADFSFVDETSRQKAASAVEKGIDITIKTQITVNGVRKGWCAQYDTLTLEPADARSYELKSISGSETIGIIEFLMEIENPSQAVIDAILTSTSWLETSNIIGFRMHYDRSGENNRKFNRYLVEDPEAEPLWARFYDIETNKPMFIDRDGIVRASHNELSDERRNGYAYVGTFAADLLKNKLPKWKEKHKILK